MGSLPLHQRTRGSRRLHYRPVRLAKAEAGRPIRFTNPVAGSQTAGRIHPTASFAPALGAVNIAAEPWAEARWWAARRPIGIGWRRRRPSPIRWTPPG